MWIREPFVRLTTPPGDSHSFSQYEIKIMNEEAIAERGHVTEKPADLYPDRSVDGPVVFADDPETGCRGVGQFEHEARTNLVHAVNAYWEDIATDDAYVSLGRGKTYKMTWDRGDGVLDRLRDSLPF